MTEPTPRLAGRVALVTGAARGLGRACAIRLAEDGADVIALDFSGEIETVTYERSTGSDLTATLEAVEGLGRRAVGGEADVRDLAQMEAAVNRAVSELSAPSVIVANAGIFGISPVAEMSADTWHEVIDVNLGGGFNTVKAVLPHLSDGSVITLISSTVGLKGMATAAHYTASKHGVVGLMRSLAIELGPRNIRVNTVHPATIDTPMIQNEMTYKYFLPDDDNPTPEDFRRVSADAYLLPTPWLEAADVANAVAFLSSDEARFITNVALPVDAGQLA